MSNHENEIQRERDFEDFYEWLNTSPCRYWIDLDDYDAVRVIFYPLERTDRE